MKNAKIKIVDIGHKNLRLEDAQSLLETTISQIAYEGNIKVVKIITKMIESCIFIDNFCHRLTLDQWGTTIFYKKRGRGQRKNNANIQPKDKKMTQRLKKCQKNLARANPKTTKGNRRASREKQTQGPEGPEKDKRNTRTPQSPTGSKREAPKQ